MDEDLASLENMFSAESGLNFLTGRSNLSAYAKPGSVVVLKDVRVSIKDVVKDAGARALISIGRKRETGADPDPVTGLRSKRWVQRTEK